MVAINKNSARRILGDVPPDKVFWCQDGRSFKNLAELEAALKDIGEETFHYHLNETKNDFANWVRDVIGDDKLAGDLTRSINRAEATENVRSRVAFLNRKAGIK